MNSRFPAAAFAFAFAVVSLASSERSAEETPKTNMKEVLKARMAEDAKKADAHNATNAKKNRSPVAKEASASQGALAPNQPLSPAPAVTASAPAATPATTPATGPTAAKEKQKENPAVLPKVEVRKGRVTELDQKLAKQEQDIARERKNMKASDVDSALNDSKIAKPLALFGGESTQFRQHVSNERVELMEAEKDLIEAIAQAKTKEEKQELQKQLDQLKAVRRDLEKSLR